MYEHLHAARPDEKTLVGKWSSDYIKIVGTRGASFPLSVIFPVMDEIFPAMLSRNEDFPAPV